ncbi:MAG: hypothetical protein K2H30_00860 [Clostridia bacterium]|nr:hypothetical protein [Clostridia bacterium]
MNYIKKFKLFLEKINIDFEQYAHCTITDKNGNEYLFSQIDEEKIKSLDWAYFLAQNNEIVLIDSRQDTLDSIKVFEQFQSGRFGQFGKYYKEEIKKFDAERFEYAKDICYLIRDMCGEIQLKSKDIYPIYIDDGSVDKFLICMFKCDKKFNLTKFEKLAAKLGLTAIYYNNNFFSPKFVKELSNKKCYNEERNAELITELKAKQRKKREEQMHFVMSQEDDVKFTKTAKKLYDEIKTYGLESLSKKNPQFQIEPFLIDVFKVLLYKKWASYTHIVKLEDEGYFFHMYEDGNEIPSKQDLIFKIIDEINERNS